MAAWEACAVSLIFGRGGRLREKRPAYPDRAVGGCSASPSHRESCAGLINRRGPCGQGGKHLRTAHRARQEETQHMIVVMNPRSSREHIDHVLKLLGAMGVESCVIESTAGKVVEIIGVNGQVDRAVLEQAPMVERVADEPAPLLVTDRQAGDRTLEVPLGPHAVLGGPKLGIIAGPCSVEDQSLLLEIAHAVKEAGAVGLRGGAFKPRTSPYSFQGLGEPGPAKRPGWPSSPRSCAPSRWSWSAAMPTCCRWAPGTCIFPCS